MASVGRDIFITVRLRSLEAYVLQRHGSVRQYTEQEQDVVHDWADVALEMIQDAWPVDTGTSRDAWSVEVIGEAGSLAIVFENPTDYSGFVHRAGMRAGGPLVRTLLPQVVNTIRTPLAVPIPNATMPSKRMPSVLVCRN